MRYRVKYKNLKHTVEQIVSQGFWGVPYAAAVLPPNLTPRQLFTWLKKRVTYKADPPNIELIQSMQSLFTDNYHGIPGAGDCDCFVAATIACAVALNYEFQVILMGNGKNPTHIACTVDGYIFDLTVNFNELRNYKRYQTLDFKTG